MSDCTGHLAIAHIHAHHVRGAALQQAVGEAAGGHAGVQAAQAAHVYCPVLQRRLQLQARPAHVHAHVTTCNGLVVPELVHGAMLAAMQRSTPRAASGPPYTLTRLPGAWHAW